MSFVVLVHRQEKNDPEIVRLAQALQMNLRKPSDIVDPSQPILPLEEIDWIFRELEKGREVRRNSLNTMKDARRRASPGYDVHDLRIEEVAGCCNIASEQLFKELFGQRDAGILHDSILPLRMKCRHLGRDDPVQIVLEWGASGSGRAGRPRGHWRWSTGA
jgi:hypothetical protein